MINQSATPDEKPFRFPHKTLWLLYFFQFASVAVFTIFMNVYYRQAGLSGTQIGLINMLSAMVGMISSFGWGYLSDLTGKNRLLIAFGAFGALVLLQITPYVQSFAAFLILACLGSLMATSPSTLVDSTTLSLLGERRNDYGRYRLGGTFGFILLSSTVGFIFDRTGLNFMFPVYGAISLLFALVALRLPDLSVTREEQRKGSVWTMIRQPAWAILIISAFLIWITTNASIMFMGVVLQELGASQGLISIAVTIGAVVEIPFMMYNPTLLRKFGPERLLLVSMFFLTIRYILIGLMPSPEWAIPINMINGFAFVFFWNSMVTLVNRMAPPGMAGTAQGLFISVVSLAGMVSSLLTGWLFDLLGPTELFFVMAVISLAALVIFILGRSRFQQNSDQRPD